MRIRLCLRLCLPERRQDVRSPEKYAVRNESTDLLVITLVKFTIAEIRILTARFAAKLDHAFEPVKAGKPTMSSAV